VKQESLDALGAIDVGVVTVVSGPKVLHEGRYRLYEKPDGNLHLVYKRDDQETEQHMEIPGKLIALAQKAAEGRLSPMDVVKEMMSLR
jgi:hypothetical protein